jgi:hypothetical protein
VRRAERLSGPEHKRLIGALLRVLDGATVSDANDALNAVLSNLPEMRLGGIKEIAQLWEVGQSTAMERIRRLGDAFPEPIGTVAAATLYDLDEVERMNWTPKKRGRPRKDEAA